MPELIERVRIGSHHEYVKWNHETNKYDYASKPKRGYVHQVVEDFQTVYHDCLVSGDWLKAHEHDLDDYEPTIEIAVNGKTLNVNGNYKQGMIKEFMSQHTERVRAGKRVVTVAKGGHVECCGGGVYVAVNDSN